MLFRSLYKTQSSVNAGIDSSQIVASLPESLFNGAERIFFIDLTLSDSSGKVVSRNFYWVPGTLTAFDWPKTNYTHTPALRHEDMTALASLPQAAITAHADIETTPKGREIVVHLDNASANLAFQVRAAIRTADGGLIAPVIWSDNWIELIPGESRTLTALLPDNAGPAPVVQLEGWNVAAQTLSPTATVASAK